MLRIANIASIANIANMANSENIAHNVMSPLGERTVKAVGNVSAEDLFLVQPDLPDWVTCLHTSPYFDLKNIFIWLSHNIKISSKPFTKRI